MADTEPKKTQQEMKILREQEKTYKLMQKTMKEMKSDKRTPSIAGKKLTKKNVAAMKGPDARKDVDEFAPELEGILKIAKEKTKEGAGNLKDSVISAIPGGQTVQKLAGFFIQRKLIKKAREKAAGEREKYNTLIKESAIKHPTGFSKFNDAVKKSYKGDDNIHEVMVDTLVKMGVTTAEELDTLFKQLEGNVSDDAVATAISAEVSKAGFETKSGGLSGIPALGGVGPSSDSSDGGAESSGVGGSGIGGAGSSGVGGLQTSPGSELALNNISSSLTTQTELLEDIKKAVSPKSGDKAKAKENKLEGEREDKATTKGLGSALESGDGDKDEESGGGIMGMIGNIVGMLVPGGLAGVGKRLAGRAGGAALKGAKGLVKGGAKLAGRGLGAAGRGLGAAKGAAPSAVKAGGGMLSKLGGWFKSAKSFAGKAIGSAGKAIGSVASKLNPLKMFTSALRTAGPKVLGSLAGLPGIGAAIQTAISAYNISEIKSNPDMSIKEKKQAIGKELGAGLGGALGGFGGAVLGTLIPIPFAGTALGAFAGGMAGNWLGGKLAEFIGGEGIYDTVSKFPIIGDLIKIPEDPMNVGANATTAPSSTGSGEESGGMDGGTISTTAGVGGPSATGAFPPGRMNNASGPLVTSANSTSAQIDQSTRSTAAAAGGSTVNSTSNIIAPSTSSSVNNTYTTTRVAQEEASMIASQMINGGSKFSVNRFG